MSFQQGLSGLNATSKSLEVIGNNIANANTYGAKTSRAEFADVYANALSGSGTSSVGIGVTLQAVAQQFTQGNITTTDNPMDLAVNGNGFFQVSDGRNPVMYSRNGQFKVDREGFIVNNDKMQLMGYQADGMGVIQPGQARPLQLPSAGINPQETKEIEIEMNLDSRVGMTSPVGLATQAKAAADAAKLAADADKAAADAAAAASPADPVLAAAAAAAATKASSAAAAATAAANALTAAQAGPAIDFSDPATYNNATSLTAYDAKGQDVALTYYFQKTGTDTWNVFVTANGLPVKGTAAAPLPTTTISFPSNGGTPTMPIGPVSFDVPPSTNSQGAQTLAIAGIQLDLTGASQYGAAFGVTNLTQDGYAPGQLSGISIEGNGIVMARYSNGQSKPAGQIELATFRNPQGLQPQGGNVWARSYASGEPIAGVPGEGNLGVLQAGALEESNVDLTAELVNMITAQRVYQANAQTIKTMDQAMQTLVNLR